MYRKLFFSISVLVLSLVSTTYGEYVISDFEDPNDPYDGWAMEDPNNPNITISNVDIGDGNSLKITDSTTYGARTITHSLVVSDEVNEFRKHTKVSLDLTRLADEWGGGVWGGWNEIHTAFTGYSEFHLIIEAGRDPDDANGPTWHRGWDLLSQRANWGAWNGDDPITFTYDYSTHLNQIDFNNLGYLGFILQTIHGNYDQPPVSYYLDNVRLVDEGIAYDPSPANHAPDVQENTDLSWTAALGATSHDVYLGTSFNDVNDANRAIHPGLLYYSENQGPNYCDPGILALDTTYYWRVDEVNGPNICKGEVWDFTTEYLGIGGVVFGDWENGMNGWEKTWQGDTTFSYSSEKGVTVGDYSLGVQQVKNADYDPAYWIVMRHGPLDLTDMVLRIDVTLIASEWGGQEVIVGPLVVQSDLSHLWDEYPPAAIDRLTGESIPSFLMPWNSNRGDAYRTYTFDFSNYSDWADANEMTIYLALQNPAQGPGNFYLDNARLTDPRIAFNPRPGNYAEDERRDPTLAWNEGKIAGQDIDNHDVYFGTSFNDVNDANRDSHPGLLHYSENQDDETYVPGTLEFDTTYYWRIDEVESPSEIYKGDVWSFTTSNYLVVDDFEDYNDTPPFTVWNAWRDGYADPDNGSQVGHDDEPYAEQTIVHGGAQSMPVDYNNIIAGLSEVTKTLTSVRDWTDEDVKALSLWFRGYPASVGSLTEGPAGTYTMTASGADIWDPSDEFHFAYKTLSGVGSIVAKVESVQNTDGWAKAGVMIRETLEPDSKHAFACITPNNGVASQGRYTTGGESFNMNQTGITAPRWVKLERDDAGNFTVRHSADGSTWEPVQDATSEAIQMNRDVYIGLAVTSHVTDVPCEAVFSNVTITGDVGMQWMDQDIGILSNDAEPMYVAVANNTGTPAVVNHDDPNATQINTWTPWDIPLKDFEDQGVDLTDVNSITIGFGDRDNPQAGGSGKMYFDDIRLYMPRCVPNLKPDLTGDCFIDYDDLQILTSDWLSSPADPNIDLYDDDKIDLKDYAVLASKWLEELLWP